MSLGRRLLLGLALLLGGALVLVVWLSRHSFQRIPVSLEVGLQGEALENSTLLLQRWLEAGGRSVIRKGGEILPGDLPEGGVLILTRVSHPITPAEVDTILAWVRRGGHLLTDGTPAPFNDGRGLAALHQALGVTLRDGDPGPHPLGSSEWGTGTDTFKDGELPYRIRRSNRWRLVPARSSDWACTLGYQGQEVLLSREEGRGRLTLTPDLSFVYYRNLADLDHAAYLDRLLRLQPGQGPVVVWSRPVELSLFTWLGDHARIPLGCLALLLLAWLWRGWPRFGPLLSEPPPRRRSLLEHLSASGRLIWWGGAGSHLVVRTRQALERRAQRLNPAYESLDLGGRAEWLAQATTANLDALAAALDDRPGRGDAELAQDLLLLERVRQRLG